MPGWVFKNKKMFSATDSTKGGGLTRTTLQQENFTVERGKRVTQAVTLLSCSPHLPKGYIMLAIYIYLSKYSMVKMMSKRQS